MKFIYKGEKISNDITDFLADLLEKYDFNLDEKNLNLFVEMCEKADFPPTYFTNELLDFDKIIDDMNHLEELILTYSINKYSDYLSVSDN